MALTLAEANKIVQGALDKAVTQAQNAPKPGQDTQGIDAGKGIGPSGWRPMMAVAQIKRPRDFTFPASVEAIGEMLSGLTNDDLNEFANELIEALVASRDKDDLLPVRLVLESWYRTTLLRGDPEHAQLVTEAQQRSSGKVPAGVKSQTVDELRSEIRRRRAS